MPVFRGRGGLVAVLSGVVVVVAILVLAARSSERTHRATRQGATQDKDPVRYGAPPEQEPQPDPTPGDAGLKGVVVDEAGAPVADALVALVAKTGAAESWHALADDGRLAVTGEAGRFTVGGDAGRRDGLVLSVRHPRFLPARSDPKGQEGSVRIVLHRGLAIQGTVSAENGAPVPGVRVVALGPDATPEDGRSEVVPAAATRVQAAVTDSLGVFRIGGLEEGDHLLNVVAPGLIVGPSRLRRFRGSVILAGSGVRYAESGRHDVELKVVAVGAVAARVVDADTGWDVLGAHVGFRRGRSFEFANQGVTPAASPLVVGGAAVRAGSDHPGQSVFGKILVMREYPVPPGLTCRATARAPGYVPASVDVPVVPLGEGTDREPRTIRLERELAFQTGAVTLRLEDRRGTRVGRARLPLVFERHGDEPPRHAYPVWFGRRGVSGRLSLRSGTYSIRAAGAPDALRSKPVTVEAGRETDATLVLDRWGGFEVEVRSEAGRVLESHGIRIERESAAEEARSPDRRVVTTVPLRRAGLGGGPLQLFRLKAGRWTIHVNHHGYAPVERVVECEPGRLKRLRIELVRTPGPWR